MRIDFNQVRLLFGHEVRSLLRDRKTLVLAVLLPLAIMPVMLFASRFVEQSAQARAESRTYKYALSGSEAAFARDLITQGLAARSEAAASDTSAAEASGESEAWTLEEIESADAAKSLEGEAIHFHIVALTHDEAAVLDSVEAEQDVIGEEAEPNETAIAEADTAAARADSLEAARAAVPTPVFQVFYRGNRSTSRSGANRVEQLFYDMRDRARETMLGARGLEIRFEDVLPVEATSVAAIGQVAGSALGRYLTLLIIFLIVAGGISVSTDLVAGEKERGTLETLLTSAIGRAEIMTAKVLLVTAVAILITLINMLNLLVYVGFGAIPLPEGLAATLSPLAMLTVLALFLPVAILIAGVLLLVSSFAKTYKEAQTYFFPVQLGLILPPLAAFLPGIELRSIVAIVPLANISVAVREVLVGVYDWPLLALSWLVTAGAAAWVVRSAGRLLSSEEYILAGGVQDTAMRTGRARLARQLPIWLLVTWGVYLIINLNYSPTTDIRLQIFINLIVLFFGVSMLIIRFYKLPFREALALRAPKPVVWLGVALAAPTTFVVAQGAARLASTFLPVPERVLEAFSEMLLPEHVPLWQLLPMMTLLPGICEEVLFRGVFIYGFRRRLSPVALILMSGLVFGLFHVALFRIVPTATIGVILAAVTILTGSLWPAIVWHAISNGTVITLGQLGLDPSTFGAFEFAVAVSLFVLGWVLIVLGRSLYPGLKTRGGARGGQP